MKLWQKVVGAIFGAVGTLFLVVCYLLIFQPQFFMGYDPGNIKPMDWMVKYQICFSLTRIPV